MEDEYYKILILTEESTIAEIKTAYRKKAMELHPDKNNNEDANEQFIFLTEAYEYLILQKTGYSKSKQKQFNQDWQTQKRQEARDRAKRYAQMKYTQFTKSDYYKKTEALNVVIAHFYLFSSILIIVGSPILGYIAGGIGGLFFGLLFVFLSVQYWSGIFTDKIDVNLSYLSKSILLIIKTYTFKMILIIFINILVLFQITLNTKITTLTLFTIFSTLTLVAFLISPIIIRRYQTISKKTIIICIIPSIFNLFFITNAIFSSNPQKESYSFVHEKSLYGQHYRGMIFTNQKLRLEKISYIDLENGIYNDIHWYRFFTDFEAMKNAHSITYTFEDGLFGLKILKSYEFK